MDKEKVLSILGLAARARKITAGESQSLVQIKSNNAKLVFLASDTLFNTTKRITDKTKYYQVRLITDLDSLEMSKAIGRENIKVITITDENFSKLIEAHLDK